MLEQRLGVGVPGEHPAVVVELDDGDVHRAAAAGQFAAGGGGQRVAGAGGVRGQGEPEPDGLAAGAVLDAPAFGEGGAHQQAPAALAVGVGVVVGGGGGYVGEGGQAAFGVVVGDLDPDRAVLAQAADLGGGAGVHDGVGDEFADQDHRVVDDLGQPPAQQRVAYEGAGGGGRPAHGFEGGGCARGDHVATSPLLWPGCPGVRPRLPVRAGGWRRRWGGSVARCSAPPYFPLGSPWGRGVETGTGG